MLQYPRLAAPTLIAGFLFTLNILPAADAPTPAATAPANPPAATAPARAGGPPAPAKPDTSKLPAPSTKADLTFDKDIQPLLQEQCGACHASARPRGGFDIRTIATVIKTSRGREVVVVSKSEDSPMIWYVADLMPRKEMPPLADREKNKPLSKDQIALLRAWIDQGAK